MKKLLLSLFVAVSGVGLVAADADAARLGGARSSGMQRQMPARQAPQSPPPSQQSAPAAVPATAGAAAAMPAAAAAKRSWMGPIAGLAAGLGIAALMSHLGFGAQFGNFLMMALLGVVALVAVRFLMQRFAGNRGGVAAASGGMRYAGAGGASASGGPGPFATSPVQQRAALPSAALGTEAGVATAGVPQFGSGAPRLPAGFDALAFERIAKMIFIRMQAANDAGDLDDLRQFATPEMFAVFRLDLQDRKGAPQKTDVMQLDAEVLDVAEEPGRQVVSVRFHGLVRETEGAAATPFDEVWHLVKPADGSHEWAIAGIGQNA